MFKVRYHSEPNHKTTHKHTEVLALDSCSPNWSSFCCSGVLSGSVEAISSLIFPISVCTPVATTTPMARPAAMLVPWAKVMIGFILRFLLSNSNPKHQTLYALLQQSTAFTEPDKMGITHCFPPCPSA